MNDTSEFRAIIDGLLDKKGCISGPIARSTAFQNALIRLPEFGPDVSDLTRAYIAYMGMEFPKGCLHCGKFMNISSWKLGWVSDYCNKDCRSFHIRSKKIPKLSYYERTGFINPFQDPLVKEKIRKTNREKYGVDYPMQSQEIRDKMRSGNMEKYGVEFTIQSPHVAEKIRNTMLSRYGVDHYSKTAEYSEKVRATSMKRYGVEHFTKSDGYKESRAARHVEKYGVPNPMNRPEVLERLKATNMEKYGVEWIMQSKTHLSKRNETNRISFYESLNDYAKNIVDSPTFLASEIERIGTIAVSERCEKWPIFVYKLMDANGIERRTMGPTKIECVVSEILDGEKIAYTRKDRKSLAGLEIDFLLDEGVGVECNGLYHHSTNPLSSIRGAERDYHAEKYRRSVSSGVRLMQFWSDEITNKTDIVRSMILNKIGRCRKIHARKCQVGLVDTKTAKDFCEKNHIKGYTKSSVKVGLFHNGFLVSVMTFRRPAFEKDSAGILEIGRFCSASGVVVVGGGSKIISYVRRNFKDITGLITYSDNRFGNGESYLKMGFTKVSDVGCGYEWVLDGVRYPRQMFQKNKMVGIRGYDMGKTEDENMFLLGYRKLYDAGHQKFKLNFK